MKANNPSIAQSEEPAPVTLRPKKEFFAEMESHFASYPVRRRRQILRELYKVAEETVALETQRRVMPREVERRIQPRLRIYFSAERALKNAVVLLDKAETIYARPPQPTNRPPWIAHVSEAKSKLLEALASLEITTALLAQEIHPALYPKGKEETYDRLLTVLLESDRDDLTSPDPPPEYEFESFWKYSDLRHFRSKAADQWFVLIADSELRRQTHAGKNQRRRIIKALFSAAFRQIVPEQTVRSILRRKKL